MKKIFVTGIGTDVGKTVASAIIVEALKADYWKPIQAGELENSDTDKIKDLISNQQSKFYENSYALQSPMSPHAAAAIDGIQIELDNIIPPNTSNHLVLEGAGGLLVPINNKHTILDIIKPNYKVIVVSRHYLGSINHTLLTIEMLKQSGIEISGIIFNGDENSTTEDIITKFSEVPIIGRIETEKKINKEVIKKYAELFQEKLQLI